MLDLVNTFASGIPTVYITSKNIFTIHGIQVTNSILYGWICGVVMMIVLIWIARRMTVRPKGGIIQVVEFCVGYIAGLVESSFDDPEKGRKYVPYFVTVFMFILFNNWLSLVPGVGEAIKAHGFPLLRPFTGDLNATLALAVVTMGVVYISSIREAGVKNYFKHFFVGNPLNPMYLFLGLMEMLSDSTRVVSLSIRLFLNVTIGETVIAVFAYLGGFVAPITAAPFVLLELFFLALQAYIFVILSVMYLAIVVNHVSEHQDEDLTEERVTETMGLISEKA
jgi:F-type H+-transporting ATPase subunit a